MRLGPFYFSFSLRPKHLVSLSFSHIPSGNLSLSLSLPLCLLRLKWHPHLCSPVHPLLPSIWSVKWAVLHAEYRECSGEIMFTWKPQVSAIFKIISGKAVVADEFQKRFYKAVKWKKTFKCCWRCQWREKNKWQEGITSLKLLCQVGLSKEFWKTVWVGWGARDGPWMTKHFVLFSFACTS